MKSRWKDFEEACSLLDGERGVVGRVAKVVTLVGMSLGSDLGISQTLRDS